MEQIPSVPLQSPKHRSSKGKILLLVLLGILVIGGVAGSYFAWHKIDELSGTNSDQSVTIDSLRRQLAEAKATPTVTPSPSPTPTPAPSIKVTLAGYGVSFQSSVEVTSTFNAAGKVYTLNTKPLAALGGACASEPLATLSRLAKGTKQTDNTTLVATAGSYDYYVAFRQTPCSQTDTGSQVQSTQTDALSAALKTLK